MFCFGALALRTIIIVCNPSKSLHYYYFFVLCSVYLKVKTSVEGGRATALPANQNTVPPAGRKEISFTK